MGFEHRDHASRYQSYDDRGSRCTWSQRYGDRHRLKRVTDLPRSILAPKKVRIYRRREHFVLQWWDPGTKATLSDRVDGDLIDAIARAREIDQRLADFRTSRCTRRRLKHAELVRTYLDDLNRRGDACEIAVATVRRYTSALAHYLNFIARLEVTAVYRNATGVDREFALKFAAYLNTLTISPNGHQNSGRRKMRGVGFVLDAVRAMFEWAADPDRGNSLPGGFRNPFLRNCVARRRVAPDMIGEPDITVAMAAEFLESCDEYQRRLFAPMIFYGLRASEPAFMFHELIDDAWVTVACLEQLDHTTKGLRNKRLPLLPALAKVLDLGRNMPRQGLVFVRRSVAAGSEIPPLFGAALEDLAREYQWRRDGAAENDGAARLRMRDAVLRDAGAVNYDLIHGEFKRLARKLGWPKRATLKDFRHLFCSAMANGFMPEHERRYLLGHAPGEGAIVAYTHLNKIAEHFRRAVQQEFGPLLQVLHEKTT